MPFPSCFKLCRSQSPLRCSLVHRFHMSSLPLFRYLACLRRSRSSQCGSFSGSTVVPKNCILLGVIKGNCPLQRLEKGDFLRFCYGVGMCVWQRDWIVSLNSTSTLKDAFLILFQTQPLFNLCHLVVQTPLSTLYPEQVLSLYLVGRQRSRHSLFFLQT